MCGRFTLTASPQEVAKFFDLDVLEGFPPRYNIAPTQPILMIANDAARRRAGVLVRWGLVPAWVKNPGQFSLLFNARAESAAEKPSFRNAMRHRRCLVPASGFYEWRRPADRKLPRQAYWIRPRDGGVLAFGGLMETWSGPDGGEIDTGLILTVSANGLIGPIHDRMPAVIAPKDFARWLDCANHEPRDVGDLMVPFHDDFFEAIAVGDKINKVDNVDPDIQAPLSAEDVVARQNPTKAKPASANKPARNAQGDLFGGG